MIERVYNLEKYLEPGKVVVILGPRQVGKTTLIKQYLKSSKLRYRFVFGGDVRSHEYLSSHNISLLEAFVGDNELLVIDEAQKIPDIGENLKLIVDSMPSVRVLVTGSAAFELAGQVGEPLVGRKWTLNLLPIATLELKKILTTSELKDVLENQLIYGGYPALSTVTNIAKKEELLYEITGSYLLRDILEFEGVKSAKILLDLLRLVAYQIGSEVSLTELGSSLNIDRKTVERYLDLFEKSFILYNLRGYSRNLRKEVTKQSKYYFYDNGIRNAIIGNFNILKNRDDIGQLWENYLFIERLKKRTYTRVHANAYFWRTYDQKEIDLIEEREGKLFGYEFKWGDKMPKAPKDWLGTYSNASYEVINKDNYLHFIL